LSFPAGETINFTASSDEPVTLQFKFEYNPWPDTDPSYLTDAVVVNGACTAYSVAVPSQGDNTFSSYLMYIVERDISVTVENVVIGGDAPTCEGAVEAPNDSLVSPLGFSASSTPVGLDFVAQNCDLSVGGDDNCATPSGLTNAQSVYVSNSEINAAGQKVITVSLDTDVTASTGAGIRVHFDSSEMTLVDVTGVLNDMATGMTIASPSASTVVLDAEDDDSNSETDSMVLAAWISFSGTWPDTNSIELFTLTFDIID